MQPLMPANPYGMSESLGASFFETPHHIAGDNFVNNWKVPDACRELIANLIDQARFVADEFIDKKAPLSFTEKPGSLLIHTGDTLLAKATYGSKFTSFARGYKWGGTVKAKAVPIKIIDTDAQVLELTSYASELHFKLFHIGYTTKKNNLDAIGTHGEGLSGACVVLSREGHNVSIESTHHQYRAEVVRLDDAIRYQLKRSTCTKPKGETVKIRIVFKPEWEYPMTLSEIVSSVRLSSTDAAAGIATDHGILLTAPHMRGKVFVKGMFVKHDPDCRFGFNLYDPEKTLVESRDRNSIGNSKGTSVFGAVISQAIDRNEALREEVLGCFLHTPGYDVNGPLEAAPKRNSDLQDGMSLTPASIAVLRRHYEQSRLPEDQRAMFIATDTPELREIRRLLNLESVLCLPVLHNTAKIIRDLHAELARDAQELDPTTRVGALHDPLRELLKVREIKQSGSANAKIGI